MPGTMIVTFYKRHSTDCKHKLDRDYLKCGCRLMLEGTATTDADVRAVAAIYPHFSKHGRFRLSADTRNAALAAEKARMIERRALDIEAGVSNPADRMTVAKAVETFMAAKRNDGLEPPTLQKLAKTTERIKQFCDVDRIDFVSDVNLTHLTSWEWPRYFKTTHSLITNQERVKSFFRYFHNAGVIARNPAMAWKRFKGKTAQASGFGMKEYQHVLGTIEKAGFSSDLQPRVRALVELMRHGGLAIIDAATVERSNIQRNGDDYRIQLSSRQKTSKKEQRQSIDNAIPRHVGELLVEVVNGNPRFVFWDGGRSGEGTDEERREAVKYWQKQVRTLLDVAGFPNATSHKFRHTLAIEMIRHGATFEDVAAALGNSVAVVAKFYSHEWAKVRQGKTDAAIKATWAQP
jgi:site-specific recombinase XerD